MVLLLAGCATTGLEKRVAELEDQVMMLQAGGVAANFYPARTVDWDASGSAAGDLDNITSTVDDDAGFVITQDDSYFGPTLNYFLPYVLDDDGGASEDEPWIIDSKDGEGDSEDWELCSGRFVYMFSKLYPSMETGSPITVYSYDTGTVFINGDNDAIEFDLPADPTGLTFCFTNDQDSTAAITVDPDASDYIVMDGVTASQGEAIVSDGSSSEEHVCLFGLDSSYWKVIGKIGTWAEATPP